MDITFPEAQDKPAELCQFIVDFFCLLDIACQMADPIRAIVLDLPPPLYNMFGLHVKTS